MHSAAFFQANYMAGQVLKEVQNAQHLVSQSLESIPPNHTDKENVPPLAPLVAPVDNTTIRENDTVKSQMLELIKSLQEELKTPMTKLTNTTTKNEPRKRKNQ